MEPQARNKGTLSPPRRPEGGLDSCSPPSWSQKEGDSRRDSGKQMGELPGFMSELGVRGW